MVSMEEFKKTIENLPTIKSANVHHMSNFVVKESVTKKGFYNVGLSMPAKEIFEDAGDLRSKKKVMPMLVFLEHEEEAEEIEEPKVSQIYGNKAEE